MKTWTTIDKSDWGHGLWQDEPDKVQWVDETTGLDCLIVRTPLGHLCGYVGVPPDHPWHGVDYGGCTKGHSHGEDDDIVWCDWTPDNIIRVHGGLTFAAGCQESDDPSTGICHVPAPGRPDDVWWFGFDHAHLGDLSPGMRRWGRTDGGRDVYRDLGYARRECGRLAAQLAGVSA